jgi:DNA invertase Pin-like site-specific DNA recombinase
MTESTSWEGRPKYRHSYASKHPTELEAEIDFQRQQHKTAGCLRFSDDEVSTSGPRHGLQQARDATKSNGSTIVISAPHRIARSSLEFVQILEQLADDKVHLEILDFGGRTVRNDEPIAISLQEIAFAFKEFEQANQLFRQRDGIARAKEKGRYTGRYPSARLQKEEIWTRFVELRQPASQIAEALGISVPSVYRVAREVDVEKAQSTKQL